MKRSSIISRRSILISDDTISLLLKNAIVTHRLGGSSLLLPEALFTGSNALIFSSGGPLEIKDDCESSSLKSSDNSNGAAASPDAYRWPFRPNTIIRDRTSLIARFRRADGISLKGIVVCRKSLLIVQNSSRLMCGIKYQSRN